MYVPPAVAKVMSEMSAVDSLIKLGFRTTDKFALTDGTMSAKVLDFGSVEFRQDNVRTAIKVESYDNTRIKIVYTKFKDLCNHLLTLENERRKTLDSVLAERIDLDKLEASFRHD